ncbi:WD repeat-containing protein 43 isoform X2 [Drosophila willistoni]|uniref:WD repeat-containing protein 43 isoform X2 n=1 Tax=Drosophila willistoni TaxID=7260 RepID=UPI001F082562|nr:WD repeat-containing protein 43 isoform X2 [Drosophila willistoni]
MEDLIIFKDLKFNLNFFSGLETMSKEVKSMFFENLKERLDMMHNGEFFNVKEMVLIDPQKLYAVNVDEFWHHSNPYVHKIFVIYLTDLDTRDQVIIYARSIFSKESDEYMTNAGVTSDCILSVLEEVPPDVRRNVVAIVSDPFRMNIRAMEHVYCLCSYEPPPLVFDVTHLLANFAKENELACINTVKVVMKTTFHKESYVEQLKNIRKAFCSGNIRDEVLLTNLNCDMMARHGKNIVSLMPIMTLDDCSKGGGLLNFMVFDAAKPFLQSIAGQRLPQNNNTMSVAKKHVMGFSPNEGQFFALVDEHGVLRIWDTEANSLKQEFTTNLYLFGDCTALTWVSVDAIPTRRAKKSQNDSVVGSNKLYIALGTMGGIVSLYSLAEGQIERTLSGDNHDGPVTSIAYNQSKGHLYTVGEDCRALVWSITEERCIADWQVGPEKPQNVVYLAKSRSLAVGARSLKIFDVETKELVETFTGHSSDINAMTSIADNDLEFILTTAHMERVISFWKIDKRGKNKASACTLRMEDPAYCLACEVRTEDGSLRVASVTRNGIHIYLLKINGLSSEKHIKPKVSLQIASDGAETLEPLHAFGAHFVQDKTRTHEILFGYGSRSLLQFERFAPNYAEKLNVIVRADPKKLYAKKQQEGETMTGKLQMQSKTQ